jgi:hypothetical protein
VSLAPDGSFGALTVTWRAIEAEDELHLEERWSGELTTIGPFPSRDAAKAWIIDRAGRLKRASELIRAEMLAELGRARILAADADEAPRR